jgi:hypothetical protein
MRDAYIAIVIALLAGLLIGACSTAWMMNPIPNKDTLQIVSQQKIYSMQWTGGNTTLTMVGLNGNVSIPITTGQIFTCNGSSTIYDGANRWIFRLP